MNASRRGTSPSTGRGALPAAASPRAGLGRAAALALSLLVASSALLVGGHPALATPPSAEPDRQGSGPVAAYLLPALGAAMDSIAAALRSIEGEVARAAPGAAEDERKTRAVRLRPKAKPGPFSMNLYRRGDFVSQQTSYWCVSASAQIMLNIMEDGPPNRSKAFQKRLHFQARRLDDDRDPFWRKVAGKARWKQGLHGLGLSDWAGVLEARGHGPYEVERAPTRKQAIRKAARAIRLTGRPAGLVVWRGAHAWVMSGFEATADPAYTNAFKVTSVFVSDPWYPSVSAVWGESRPPNARVPVRALGADYLRYNRPGRRHPMRDGKFMLILPTLPPGTEVRTGA